MKRHIEIVIPVYNESSNLRSLIKELDSTVEALAQYNWTYTFVNDGSKDDSIEVIRTLKSQFAKVRGIDLAKNFGKEIALTAGVELSHADAVICMDADLQHPPSFIPNLVSAWENGAEVVATVRKRIEKQPLLRRAGSHLFYYLMRTLSELDTTSQTTDFRLIDAKVVTELRKVREKKRMFRAIVDWLGFRKVWLEFEAPKRELGTSAFSYRKLWNLAFDSFISYSSFPLRFIGYLGAFTVITAGSLLGWMLLAQWFFPHLFNYTPLAMIAVGNTLLIGIVLAALGLMSLYINKIYAEVIDRPLYAIRELINNRER